VNFKQVRLIVIAMLLLGILDFPYAYYTLLRIVVTVVSAFAAYNAVENDQQPWMIIFGAVAILFNPIIPIYLNKEIWVVIDVIVAGLFGVSVFVLKDGK
jgi:hypothetical protein|tara:strand:+ start:852 stop:1148 length:297 start_codon:yes stop_codon:yes gene_type:complete